MLKFSEIKLLGDGKVRARGPFAQEPKTKLKRVNFMLSQENVMIEGEGRDSGKGGWVGEADAGELLAGQYVYAVGVAVLVKEGWPPTVQTFTWCEQAQLEG